MHNTIVRIFQKLTTNLEMISLFSFQPKVNSFENFRFLYISLNGIQCLTKWILHFKNNDDFLMDDFWKNLTIVTTLFFLLPFDSKVNNTKIKKGENLQICSKTWKSENCLDRGSNPGLRWQARFWDLSTKSSRLHLEEELALFCCQKWGGGLGPGVSALPMGPMDVLENYIFEISMKNWKNKPEENFLEGFFNLTVSKKRGEYT